MKRIIWLLWPAALLVSGCDWTDTSAVEEQIVVEAYLQAAAPMPTIRLTRSVSVSDTFRPGQRAVEGAVIEVQRLGEDGEVAGRIEYVPVASEPGLYHPRTSQTVIPLATYRLVATAPTGEVIESTTTVPDTLSILSTSADSAVYNGRQIELILSRSAYPGRQAYIIFTSEALDASEATATRTTRRLLDESDDPIEETINRFRVTSSPTLSESTYLVEEQNRLEIPIPWLGIRFYGPYIIRISAVDDNLYDFLRSQMVQQGGSTFLPGEVPNILDRVSGGTGVFGSYASAAMEIFVIREN